MIGKKVIPHTEKFGKDLAKCGLETGHEISKNGKKMRRLLK